MPKPPWLMLTALEGRVENAAGSASLAACKLVFVDLDDLGGMARGAATVLIGLLLLGIGQLAPRPEEGEGRGA